MKLIIYIVSIVLLNLSGFSQVITSQTTPKICGIDSSGTAIINTSGFSVQPLFYELDSAHTEPVLSWTNIVSGLPFNENIFDSLEPANYRITIWGISPFEIAEHEFYIDSLSFCFSDVITNNTSCQDTTDGSIDVIIADFVGYRFFAYLYKQNQLVWDLDTSFEFEAEPKIEELSIGNYKLTILDQSSGDTIQRPFSISHGITISYTPDTINGNCNDNGGIEFIGVAGGTLPYEFSIDSGNTFSSSSSFMNLSPGEYYVAVKDSNSCITYDNVFLDTNYTALYGRVLYTADATFESSTNGVISLKIMNGSGPFTFSLNNENPIPFSLDTLTIDTLSKGTHTITIYDQSSCSYTLSFLIDVAFTSTVAIDTIEVTNASCDQFADGQARVSVPDYLFYQYDHTLEYFQLNQWIKLIDNQLFLDTAFSNLDTGKYRLTLFDDFIGDSLVKEFYVGSLFDMGINTYNPLCYNDSNGVISIMPIYGGSGIEASIDSGFTYKPGIEFYNLAADTYHVALKNSLGCLTRENVVLLTSPFAVAASLNYSLNASSISAADGSFEVIISSGSPPFTYKLNNDDPISFTNDTLLFTNLSVGSYSITITDLNCTYTIDDIKIFYPIISSKTIDTIIVVDAMCSEYNNGEAHVALTDSINQQYRYSLEILEDLAWDRLINKNILLDTALMNLSSGSYRLTIYDSTITDSVSKEFLIQSSMDVSLDPFTGACYGDNGGINFITSDAGTGIQYSIDSGLTYQQSAQFMNIPIGFYSIAVTNTEGCLYREDDVEIKNNDSSLKASLIRTTNTSTDVSQDGSFEVKRINGIAPFTYKLNNGPAISFTSETLLVANIGVGSYDIIIADSSCEFKIDSIEIIATIPVALSSKIDSSGNILCFGDNNGYLRISVEGTGQNDTVLYSLDDGITFQDSGLFVGLAPATYEVKISINGSFVDSIGKTVNITSPEKLAITALNVVNPGCIYGLEGSIQVFAKGGTTPFNYFLNDSLVAIDLFGIINNVKLGLYDFSIVDSNLCTVTKTDVLLSNQLAIDIEPRFLLSSTITEGDTIKLIDLIMPQPDSVLWVIKDEAFSSNRDTFYIFQKSGNYDVTLIGYYSGCNESISKTITVDIEIQKQQDKSIAFKENTLVNELSIYPIPSKDNIHIDLELNEAKNIRVTIVDYFNNKVLVSNDFVDKFYSKTINLSSLSEGLYLLQVNIGNDFRHHQVIVKID